MDMTRIGDLMEEGTSLSFEFFPPKTEAAEEQLDAAIADLAPLGPSFVSVTYGALGSTRDSTRDIVVRFNNELPFPAMAHLTCVGHTRDDIKLLLDEYAVNGVHNILALGGDPPPDGSELESEFDYADELVDLVRSHPAGFSVGVAAHPELHPRSPDRESDRRHLAAKLAKADFGVTQFFFTTDYYTQMVEELAELGCDTPVVPGVMPPGATSVAALTRMAGMNGTELPGTMMDRLNELQDEPDDRRQFGIEFATQMSQDLLAAGAPGLHLYALNRSASVSQIVTNLGWGSAAN